MNGFESSYLEQLQDWAPRTVRARSRPANVTAPENFEADIHQFMEKSLQDLQNPEINLFMRPELIPEGVVVPEGMQQKPGEMIHHD